MLVIYLARHGQDEDNAAGIMNGHRDMPLTDIGREQARALAEHIRASGLGFDAVYSSPLHRARETAEILASAAGAPAPSVMPDLIERDFGTMTGKRVADVELLCAPEILKTATVTYFLAPAGGETFPDCLARAGRVFDTLTVRHRDGTVLIVSHGDFGKMLYARYYNLDWRDVLATFHFGNAELLELSPDSPAARTHVFEAKQYNP
jgi:broad specificity phosphatase PhoE